MDVAAMSMALSQVQVKQQASISVMRKVMGTGEDNNNALMEMMQTPVVQNASHPGLGNNVDLKA